MRQPFKGFRDTQRRPASTGRRISFPLLSRLDSSGNVAAADSAVKSGFSSEIRSTATQRAAAAARAAPQAQPARARRALHKGSWRAVPLARSKFERGEPRADGWTLHADHCQQRSHLGATAPPAAARPLRDRATTSDALAWSLLRDDQAELERDLPMASDRIAQEREAGSRTRRDRRAYGPAFEDRKASIRRPTGEVPAGKGAPRAPLPCIGILRMPMTAGTRREDAKRGQRPLHGTTPNPAGNRLRRFFSRRPRSASQEAAEAKGRRAAGIARAAHWMAAWQQHRAGEGEDPLHPREWCTMDAVTDNGATG